MQSKTKPSIARIGMRQTVSKTCKHGKCMNDTENIDKEAQDTLNQHAKTEQLVY